MPQYYIAHCAYSVHVQIDVATCVLITVNMLCLSLTFTFSPTHPPHTLAHTFTHAHTHPHAHSHPHSPPHTYHGHLLLSLSRAHTHIQLLSIIAHQTDQGFWSQGRMHAPTCIIIMHTIQRETLASIKFGEMVLHWYQRSLNLALTAIYRRACIKFNW